MTDSPSTPRAVRFGIFELDRVAGELRKNGLKVRLQDQPLQLLSALVERPGEVVTREELKERLWPADTYVDFDRSLNTAASRLREALGDSASNPRFVETLPKRGYRFLASVESPGTEPPALAGAEVASLERESSRRLRVAWSVAALAALAVVTLLVVQFRERSSNTVEGPLRRFTITPPGGLRQHPPTIDVAISPNGSHIAYISAENRKLGILDLVRGQHRLLEGTDGAFAPFWSPDSQFVGFISGLEIRKIPVDGGPATRICERPALEGSGASWSPEGGSIVFDAGSKPMLYEVPAIGGTPNLILSPDELEELPETLAVRTPHFLPAEAGRRVLVFAATAPTGKTLVVQDLDTGRREILTPGDSPFYSPSGHIVYELAGATFDLWALPFSLSSLKATGRPFPISEGSREPTVAADQTLVHSGVSASQRLTWFDRRGERIGSPGQPQRSILHPELSPDERRMAVSFREGGEPDIWVYDVDRGVKNRLTTSLRNDRRPIWSSSGKDIVFTTTRGGKLGIYRKAADGGGEAVLLHASDMHCFASDWSRDGRHILYDRDSHDIWHLERNSDGGFEARPLLATQFIEKAAQFSPDNRWVAYVSNESGEFEVYVRRFPEGDRKQRISENGGLQVRWSRDGRRLYYVEEETLFEAPVTPGPELAVGDPQALFRNPDLRQRGGSAYPHYDVTADGERFVFGVDEAAPLIHVVENWFAEFRDPEGATE